MLHWFTTSLSHWRGRADFAIVKQNRRWVFHVEHPPNG